jgi:hypothetical protein
MGDFGECMITVLQVNGIELTIDYELQAQPVYFGDLESEYIEIEINKVVWMGTDVLPLIDALEDTEALKLIIRDRFEDRE